MISTFYSPENFLICCILFFTLGDFAILINSGMPLKKALLYNFLSACTAFGGLVLGILIGELDSNIYIFAFAGGLFIYISIGELVSLNPTLKFK